jgi:glucose/arabinose dehydrogenase
MKTKWRYLAFYAAAALAAANYGRADTVNLTASADTFINSGSPGNNAGGHVWFSSGTDGLGGNRRGLLRFDLSSIPAGSTVTSVVLSLTVGNVPSLPMDSNFELRKLNAGWGEGNKLGNNGAPASNDESTWIDRISGTASWAQPGGLTEAASQPSASTPVGSIIGAVVTWTGPNMVADAQSWLDNPAQNFGWMLRSAAEGTHYTARAFFARENSTGRPTLQVGFTPASGNNPPMVSITNPTNGASFSAPATVTIEVNASDSDGSVTNVAFYSGGVLLGNDATAPYSLEAELSPGAHTLTAVATDNMGGSTTSDPVAITVGNTVIVDPIAERIPKGDITIELKTVAAGMASPVGLVWPDDGTGRLFVADQDGKIWVVTGSGTRLPTPLLDVGNRLVLLGGYDERGLLGLAVHPNFTDNQLIYTYTSETNIGGADFPTGLGGANNHQSVVAEWKASSANPNVVDPATRRVIMRIDQPQSNHNGGAMQFGPDGFLYISLGDGGASNDSGAGHVEGGNAQDLNVILGKLLRIDVNGNNSANGQYGIPASNPFVGASGLDEIYAYGLRNAFSFSFDRESGQLYVPDVGQNKVEEVNLVTAGGNYGWNLREGAFWFDPSNGTTVTGPVRTPPDDLIDPIAQYDHDDGFAVIGGYVYRGTQVPALSGRYVFGDWGSFGAPSGRLFYLDATNGIHELRIGAEDRPLGLWLKGFGEGPDGELYVLGNRWLGPSGNSGVLLKINPAPAPIAAGVAVAGGSANLSWIGGQGPFAVQTRRTFEERLWMDAIVTNANTAAFPLGAQGFFRVKDAASENPIPLSAHLTGAAERPTPNDSPGSGTGLFALEGNALTFNISYSGLSGTANNAHIHGPAPASLAAGVMIDLAPFNGGSWGSSGTFSGVIVLTDSQKALLLGGKTYVNIHSTAFPGGEIRGQIVPVNMEVELSGASEVPPLNVPGRGLGNLTLVGNRLTMNVTYSGLTGTASAAHIHGPAPIGQNAGVMVDLAPFNGGAFGSSGRFSGTAILTPNQLAALVDGLTYINIHTVAHGGGEIRGQILPRVTGVPLTTILSGEAELPPTGSAGTGNGTFSLDGNTLTFNVAYSGLSGPATGAHIHGPAGGAQNASVLINLAPFNGSGFGASGNLSGSVTLTHAQRYFLLGSQTYVNLHTAAFPNGEIRGQIAPVLMSSGLSGKNERPSPASTPGHGSATLALVRDRLTMNLTYRDLHSDVIGAHIHGPASFTGTAGILVDLASLNGGSFGSSGALSGTVSLTISDLLNVIDQRTYINLHTTNYPSGEIRGHLMR